MRPLKTNELAPLCETQNRCSPLPCCEACHTCMKAQYYQAKADLKEAFRDYFLAYDFFSPDDEPTLDENKLYSAYFSLITYMDALDEVVNG